MLNEVDFKLSKELSYALRHNPSAYSLALDDNGWCSLDSLLKSFNSMKSYGIVDVDRIYHIIDDCEKKRFEIDEKNNRIRATYGHSIKDHPIVVTKPEQPPYVLFHGTSRWAWEKIKLEGLKPMSRQYVHLSTDKETAIRVGKRHDDNPVVIAVYAFKAWLGNGVKFYHSTNDQTWMSEQIPSEYLRELRPLEKEYIEEVENKIVELEKKQYIGHEFNTNVFDEKKETLFLLSLSSEERIKRILEIFESFPNGLWRKKQYPNIDKYINTIDNIRNGHNFDKLTGKTSLQWYSGNGKVFGYEFTHGIDDGYPETTTIHIPSELLYLDDDALERRLYSEVLGAMRYTKTQLEKELADASSILREMEKKKNDEK